MKTHKLFRVRMYVGPTSVEHYAERARSLGYTDVIEGTEHIHFTTGRIEMDPHSDTPITDRHVIRQQIGTSIYGEPGHLSVWHDVELLREASPPIDRELFKRYQWHRGRTGQIGRDAQVALLLARAERWLSDHPELDVIWFDDQSPDLSWMDDDERAKPHTVECCAIVRPCADHGLQCPHAEYLSSLGNIVDADDDYRRIVTAELASEIMEN